MKKLTKAEWRKRGVYNSHDIAKLSTGLYISYRPAEYGRASQSAAWQVILIGKQTDPKGHWRDNGHKTLTIYRREEKAAALTEATEWVKARFKIEMWERDPWGDWHPNGNIAKAMIACEKVGEASGG